MVADRHQPTGSPVADQSGLGRGVETADEVGANQTDALAGGLRELVYGLLIPFVEATDTSAVLADNEPSFRARWERPKERQ